MRTTVTVDSDVENLLREAMRQSGQSFKVTLNEAVRKGLADIVPEADERPFVVRSKNMGLRTGIDPAKLQELADEMEVEAHLEVTRKFEERLVKKKS